MLSTYYSHWNIRIFPHKETNYNQCLYLKENKQKNWTVLIQHKDSLFTSKFGLLEWNIMESRKQGQQKCVLKSSKDFF